MQYSRALLLVVVIGSPAWCYAQGWSIGGAGGFGFYKDATITNAIGSAKAGFGPRVALGGVLGQDMAEYFGGELRYTFRDGDTELKSGGREANMDAAAHALHYDFLVYATNRRARLRPFGAVGGGIKYYDATGREDPLQPLSDFAFLTHAHQVEGLVSFGGGVKFSLTEHWLVRLDFRDYLTPFPNKLIAPAPSAKIHGWLHDFVETVGVDWRFGKR